MALPSSILPRSPSLLVVGAGPTALSLVYHLLAKQGFDMSKKTGPMLCSQKSSSSVPFPPHTIVMVEADNNYSRNSACLSAGGLRTQFSLRENVLISNYGLGFVNRLRDDSTDDFVPPPPLVGGGGVAASKLANPSSCDLPPPSPRSNPCGYINAGYLFLAGSQAGASSLQANSRTQAAAGVSGIRLLKGDKASIDDHAHRRGASFNTPNNSVSYGVPPGHSTVDDAQADLPNLKATFPYLKTDDLLLGAYSKGAGDGFIDPYSYMNVMKRAIIDKGVHLVSGSVVGGLASSSSSSSSSATVYAVNVDGGHGTFTPREVALCAGASSGKVLSSLLSGASLSLLRAASLPVVGRRRVIHTFQCCDDAGLAVVSDGSPAGRAGAGTPPSAKSDEQELAKPNGAHPLTVDPTGVWYRSEGVTPEGVGPTRFICGLSPDETNPNSEPDPDCTLGDDKERDARTFEYNEDDARHFRDVIWPALFERVPIFGGLRPMGGWAGLYDFNKLDQNALLGRHPMVDNVVVATGFSGHGLQQAAGAGREGAEVLLDLPRSIDLRRLSVERLFDGSKGVFEEGIV